MKLLLCGVIVFLIAIGVFVGGAVHRLSDWATSANSSPLQLAQVLDSEASSTTRRSSLYRPSFCELYRWAPEDYFEDSESIEICLAIQSRDFAKLRTLIKQGYDLNTPGRAGVTVLFWAFFDDNLGAFKILLDAGADPDQKLTDFIRFELRPPLNYGDSVIYTCLRERWHDYFLAAFAHTKDPHQVDAAGRTLLQGITEPGCYLDQRVIDSLVEAGVDLNVTDKYGSTVAMRAIGWHRPQLCLALLKAGVDPTIPDNEGRTLATKVDNLFANQFMQENYGDQLEELRTWLVAHAAQTTAETSATEDDAAAESACGDEPS